MSHINGAESGKTDKPGGVQAILHALSPKVIRFHNDPDYLLNTNTALLKLYIVLLLPLAAYHLAVGFGIAESWYLWAIALLFLIPHFGISLLVSLLYSGTVAWNVTIDISLPAGVALVAAGVYFGIVTAALMHTVVHLSIKPRWLNNLIGEICALQQLVGVAEWGIAHILFHHRYPDDPENDPHPPEGQSYPRYALNMKFTTAMFVNNAYFRKWGQTEDREKTWQKTGFSILAVGALRVTLWFLLLGPVYFMLFYIPSQLASMLLYTHFNYFTHLPDENGNYVPVNCDNRGLIRILNALTFNAYYHKNHHDNPGAFNPKYVA